MLVEVQMLLLTAKDYLTLAVQVFQTARVRLNLLEHGFARPLLQKMNIAMESSIVASLELP